MANEETVGNESSATAAHSPAGPTLVSDETEPTGSNPAASGFEQSSFGRPFAFILAPRLQQRAERADLPGQLQLAQAEVQAALTERLVDRGAVIRPDPAVQGVAVSLTVSGNEHDAGGPAERIYRFQIALFFDQSERPPVQILPRLFGETVQRRAPGLIFAGADEDSDLTRLFMELLGVLEHMAGSSVERKRAFLPESRDPYYCSRLYTVRYFAGGLEEPLRQLQQAVRDTEEKLREAFSERGALVLPHAQSQQVELLYSVPSLTGGKRLFRFQIELQLGVLQRESERMYTITPRLFAEVVRQDSQGVMSMGQGDDAYFSALVQEVEAILRKMAPL